MPFKFLPNTRYRMPVIFGPAPGPRQQLDGTRPPRAMTRVEMVASSYLTDAAKLESLLPEGFSLDGEPVVTVEYMYMSELRWLAGRGYNTLGVRFPVQYRGSSETVRGPFLAVLWENMADPILSGREELGFAKLFCEIPPPRVMGGKRIYSASWQGHPFLKMELDNMQPADFTPGANDGILHYRYIPSTNAPGQHDSLGVVLTPSGAKAELIDHSEGTGTVEFLPSTWEQLPTLVHIVEGLRALPVIEPRGASITNCYFDNALRDHRLID